MVLDLKLAPENRRRLVVFADDWGRHPSSCQHLVRELLGTCDVTWVNTIGTRGLTIDSTLLRRGAQKLAQWARKAKDPGPTDEIAPAVHNPRMYPGFRTPWQRSLNARLLSNYLGAKVARLGETVVVSTLPITADLPARLGAKRWVYYCVDDFSAWPGLDSRPLQQMEKDLVSRVDRIVSAGENLASRIRAMGRDSEIISHGIDVTPWMQGAGDAALLADLPRPIVLFWGLVDRRLDVELVSELSSRMQSGSIAFVGPQQDPDPRLLHLPRVHLLGATAYENLPALARQASVLVMPYADLPVTRAMQPLKLREYLATGRPVVVSRLPAVAGWDDCLDVADGAADFAAKVLARLERPTPDSQTTARSRLRDESWANKARRFAEVLFHD